MLFKLKILGSSAGLPAYHRFTSAQLLEVGSRKYLIDVGEGVQIRLNQNGISKQNIDAIFISHLHGDHIYGLIGLLNSMSMLGRTADLMVHAPEGLESLIRLQLELTNGKLPFELTFQLVDTTQHLEIYRDQYVSVFTIPLTHTVPTCGYLFREHARERNMNPSKILEYNIPFSAIPSIKQGKDYQNQEGVTISNTELTIDPPKPRSYAYCSDTLYDERIVPIIKDVSILFHEATFMHESVDIAAVGKHSTALQAGQMAALANVQNLVIGHFSARYEDSKCLVMEAQKKFKNVYAGEDNFEINVTFR